RAAVKGGAEVAYAEDGKVNGEYDVIIAVIGEDPYAETQGDRANDSQDYSLAWTMDRETAKDMGAGPGGINIRARDMDMLWEVYDNGCPVIVIMLSGRPMTIGDEFENWDAFVAAWLPGSEGGGGIADVLFGDHDFTGRTPYTWRKTVNGEVLYPFGYGLSNARQDAGDFDYAVNNGAVTVTGYRGKGKDIAIPEKIGGLPVTAVGDGAFSRQKLTSVTIPGSVTAIGDRSFSYNRLSSLVLPDSVATVGYMAFSNNRLASLTLPDELVSIGMNAFSANRLKNLSLPGALDYIGDGAFTKNLLDSVSVPKTIWNFNSYAFDSYVKITRN
ncbi:MAG: leucine-rich repeat protein, partial [Treponema sp.]|nr:leucine-rich repeat protein [Treponema sp.]